MGKPRDVDDVASDVVYFNKSMERVKGTREMAFSVALEQTIKRAKYDGASILVHRIVARLLRAAEIEGTAQGAYYALSNSLTSLALKGDDIETMGAMCQKARDRLEPNVVDDIGEIFGL